MKNQKLILLILSVVTILNLVVTSALLVSLSIGKTDSSTGINSDESVAIEEERDPPEIINLDPELNAIGVLDEVIDENTIKISRDRSDPEDMSYTISITSDTIITDTIRTELEILKEGPRFLLSEIPIGSVINAQCETLEDQRCVATVIQFIDGAGPIIEE